MRSGWCGSSVLLAEQLGRELTGHNDLKTAANSIFCFQECREEPHRSTASDPHWQQAEKLRAGFQTWPLQAWRSSAGS